MLKGLEGDGRRLGSVLGPFVILRYVGRTDLRGVPRSVGTREEPDGEGR